MMAYWHLFRAEWEKIAGNRFAAAFLIWIFPIGTAVASLLAFVVFLLSSDARESLQATGVYPWHEAFQTIWQIINTPISRYTIVVFAAIMFASEYQNGTWKYLVTRRARATLILNKFITITAFMLTSFVLANVIHGVAQGLAAVLTGTSFGEFNGAILRQFLQDSALNLVVVTIAAFFGAMYAALAAMITSSIVGSVMAGVLITLAEESVLLINVFLTAFLNVSLIGLYRFSPSYNLANINSWGRSGDGFDMIIGNPDGTMGGFTALPLTASVLIIAVWLIGLIWLTVTIFRNRDIRD